MTRFNSLLSKTSLFCLALLLLLSCKDDDEVTINIPVPTAVAPTPPERNTANVKSLYSNAYTNEPVDSWNSPRASSTTEVSFIQIAGDDVIQYRDLNFARVEFSTTPINTSTLSTLHMDIWTPDPINEGSEFKVLLIDFGANGTFNGGDDSSHEITLNSSSLSSGNWISLDIPLADFTGLNSRANLAQMVLSGTLANLYIDNVYFYGEAEAPPSVTPLVAAPVPTEPAAEVLSIFSDTYTNVAGTNFYPNWGQPAPGVTVTETPIQGNNTLHYANFTYQGVELGSAQDVSGYQFLHLDYYSVNSTGLNVSLIGGGETLYALTVPTSGWSSIDIPLSAFAGVNLSQVIQFKFDGGNGSDIFLDNIYFHTLGGGGNSNCPTPPAGEFIVDGGFEANEGCWQLNSPPAASIVTNESNGGTNSARLETFVSGAPNIKQERFGAGAIQPNTAYTVTFDIRSDANDPLIDGAILQVLAFSESSSGATQAILEPAYSDIPSTWTTRTYSFTTSANVNEGVSLLIQLTGSGIPTTSGTIFIDNVSFRAQ